MPDPAILGPVDADTDLAIDVDRLIGGHACIVANTGGGKSGLIRRLLEQTHGRVQHVVLDGEDEFYTLRERFDYVIAGGDGADTPARVQDAAGLAMAVLQHDFSLIAQINDLGFDGAPEFVGAFLEALIAAPRDLWRPLLVVVDEAQRFVPRSGKTDAQAGVKALVSQGRKRGFTGILAGTKLTEIDPAVRAQCNNWLLGRVGQSLDRKTMAEQLGFSPKEARERLQTMEQRQFWAMGPALAREPVLFHVADVETTPVRAGQAKVPTPPAPEALRFILADIATPAEPESQNSGNPEIQIIAEARIAELEAEVSGLAEENALLIGSRHFGDARNAALSAGLRDIADQIEALLSEHGTESQAKAGAEAATPEMVAVEPVSRPAAGRSAAATSEMMDVTAGETAPTPLNKTALDAAALLKAIAPEAFDWNDVLLLLGRRPNSGDSRAARKALREHGLIDDGPAGVSGSEALGDRDDIPLGHWPVAEELIDLWAAKLRGPGGDILRALSGHGPASPLVVAQRLDRSATSGWWRQGMKDLRNSNLVRVDGQVLTLHPLLLEDQRN